MIEHEREGTEVEGQNDSGEQNKTDRTDKTDSSRTSKPSSTMDTTLKKPEVIEEKLEESGFLC
jgi:hypothetical protein